MQSCRAGKPTGHRGEAVYTLRDLIERSAAAARNHGDFVSDVALLANQWVTHGLLAPSDRGELQLTAARARIPCRQRPMMKAIGEAVVTVAMLAGCVVAAIAVANLVDYVRLARCCTDATSRASR